MSEPPGCVLHPNSCPRGPQAAQALCEECGGNGNTDLSNALLSLQARQDLKLFRGSPKVKFMLWYAKWE